MTSARKMVVRAMLLLAAAALVPACGDSVEIGTPGATGGTGPTGPSGANPPAVWSDPINISKQLGSVSSYDAYGQQAVFTADGRLHVVYFAYDYLTDQDQLCYTSAADPYTVWDAPVRVTVTDDAPTGFDLTAASDNSVHVAFVRNDSFNGYSNVLYTRNTAALRLAFTETLIFEETYSTDEIFSARILMRGTTAHVVWTGYNGSYYYNYSNNSTAWPTTTPVVLDPPNRFVDFGHFTFARDLAGAFHLVYYIDDGEERYVLYRPLPLAAATLGSAQIVNDIDDEFLSFDLGAPIVQFDASDNVFVFWRRWQESDGGPSRAIVCNIKGATAALFQPTRATVVTVHPYNGDGIISGDFIPVFDVQVAPDGRIHAAWKSDDNTYGTSGNYPLFYRTKSPGLNASIGWEDAQAAAWLQQPGNSTGWDGGIERSLLVRLAADGAVHVFYSDTIYEPYTGYYIPDLHHAELLAGSSTWRSTGTPNRPTVNESYPTPTYVPFSYFLEAGVEEDGTPFVLFSVDPYGYYASSAPDDIRYAHYWEGSWSLGTDVNGPEQGYSYGDFWVGQDPQARLHAVWQQEVDPFNYSGYYDLVHSYSPDPTLPAWNPKGIPSSGGYGGGS